MRRNNTSQKNSAMSYALKLLNIRPRTRSELKSVLLHHGYSVEEMNQVIFRLMDLGYLNDIKFMESWCYFRRNISPRSRWYVKKELLQKGISFSDLEEYFDQFYSGEEEIICLEQIIRKKASKNNFEKEKIIFSLLRKGFSQTSILEVFNLLETK